MALRFRHGLIKHPSLASKCVSIFQLSSLLCHNMPTTALDHMSTRGKIQGKGKHVSSKIPQKVSLFSIGYRWVSCPFLARRTGRFDWHTWVTCPPQDGLERREKKSGRQALTSITVVPHSVIFCSEFAKNAGKEFRSLSKALWHLLRG